MITGLSPKGKAKSKSIEYLEQKKNLPASALSDRCPFYHITEGRCQNNTLGVGVEDLGQS